MFTVEERRKYIGGSDIAVVMGMSRWKTPLKLWLEKTGQAEPDDLSQVEAVQLGTELEEFVAQKFAKESGKLDIGQSVVIKNKMIMAEIVDYHYFKHYKTDLFTMVRLYLFIFDDKMRINNVFSTNMQSE